MKILLDIDGTLVDDSGKFLTNAERLLNDNHEIILYSANEKLGSKLAKQYNIPFIDKSSKHEKLIADVLIDDYAYFFIKIPNIQVNKYFTSITEFYSMKQNV